MFFTVSCFRYNLGQPDAQLHYCSIANARDRHCEDCAPIARKARAQSEDLQGSGLPPSSAKIRIMLKLLQSIKSRSDGKEKTIIFSQVSNIR